VTKTKWNPKNKYIRIALRQIDRTEYDPSLLHRHAAVVAKGGRVLSTGRNRKKTHPGSRTVGRDGEEYCCSVHAEMDAIARVSDKAKLRGATIYIARKGRNNEPGMSCPCKMCQSLISESGIKRAVFTTEYGTGTMEFTGEIS
jgi:deoxycytidylate deaminase